MENIKLKSLNWTNPNEIESIAIWENSEKGGMKYWNVPKGKGFNRHSHKGYEHIVIIKGKMDFSNKILEQGDCLLTKENEEHEAIALEDSIILVINQRDNA